MESVVNNFLEQKKLNRPVLLALSGGPDSLALLHILLGLRQETGLQFAVAHVDHGWRPESNDEAQQLKNNCETLGLSFHSRKLDPSQLKGNLEAACRDERLRFFRELCAEHNYEAVLLAHHADDHAETLFKRLMEGTTLPHLHGLREVTEVNGLVLWRPLLQVTKKEIEGYIAHHNLKPFSDSTNFDPKYLRTRLRSLLPELSKKFGKDVSSTLIRLGKESTELHAYLCEKLAHHRIHTGPLGSYIELPSTLHPFEMRFLIRKLCERENVFFSHHLIEQAALHVLNRQSDCWVLMGQKRMYVDRGCVFVLREVVIPARQKIGSQFGPWEIRGGELGRGWQSIWSGIISLPHVDCEIGLPDNTVNKRWSNAKIPAFLKSYVPVLWQGDQITSWCFE